MGGGSAGVLSLASRDMRVFRARGPQRNILVFVLVALGAFVITLFAVPKPSGGAFSDGAMDQVEVPADVGSPVPSAPSPLPGETTSDSGSGVAGEGLRGYSLPLAEVRGLSARSVAGSRVEIWVSWRRDVGRGSQVQRVVREAIVGEVLEPTVPEGPETIELLIPVKDFPDFLAAHEFGSLSAATVPF
jgi:hypothetical protein